MSDDLLERITEALKETQHPSINASLPQLGMVKNIKVEGNVINLDLNLPFANVPESISHILRGSIEDALKPFGMELMIGTAIMDEQEKQHFLEVETSNWKGL
ncbi:MAG: iron-sulfur cluster assembly protein [Promethearchaeota archaeon]